MLPCFGWKIKDISAPSMANRPKRGQGGRGNITKSLRWARRQLHTPKKVAIKCGTPFQRLFGSLAEVFNHEQTSTEIITELLPVVLSSKIGKLYRRRSDRSLSAAMGIRSTHGGH